MKKDCFRINQMLKRLKRRTDIAWESTQNQKICNEIGSWVK